jgi:hypothetical protein
VLGGGGEAEGGQCKGGEAGDTERRQSDLDQEQDRGQCERHQYQGRGVG